MCNHLALSGTGTQYYYGIINAARRTPAPAIRSRRLITAHACSGGGGGGVGWVTACVYGVGKGCRMRNKRWLGDGDESESEGG